MRVVIDLANVDPARLLSLAVMSVPKADFPGTTDPNVSFLAPEGVIDREACMKVIFENILPQELRITGLSFSDEQP